MTVMILTIIGLVLLVIGFITNLWIIFLLAAIFFIISFIIIYKSKRRQPAFSEKGEDIRIESEFYLGEQTVADTASTQKLNRLTELRNAGILTEEEYEQKKSQIIRETAPAKKIEPDAATAEKIKKLDELRNEGILTEEEYEQKKSQILKSSG